MKHFILSHGAANSIKVNSINEKCVLANNLFLHRISEIVPVNVFRVSPSQFRSIIIPDCHMLAGVAHSDRFSSFYAEKNCILRARIVLVCNLNIVKCFGRQGRRRAGGIRQGRSQGGGGGL